MNGAYVLDNATKAMIAALESQEERDRLTHFLTFDLKDGKGTGILGDVFLLLKANRCYMEKLPGQFNRELVKPIIESMLRLETSIGLQAKTQDKILVQANRCAESSTAAAGRMEAIVPKVEGVVQTAFNKIDPSALTRKIQDTVMEGVVKPVAKVNDRCDQLQEKLEKRVPVLTGALKWLTVGNFFVWALSCALLIGAVAIYVVFEEEQEMVTQLQTRVKEEIEKVHATAQVNEQTLNALARLNVAIEINPEKDWWGNVMPYHYCISIKGADSGATIYKNWERYGAIFVHEEITPISL
ncbi:MAG: hypothetical protein LV481_12290 [Methylacidiphilales bacterium]|nr:hypothetical protein [Candidatus Methylacidiphilales bacterium]